MTSQDYKQELLTSLHHLLTLYGYEADQALGGQAAMTALKEKHYDVVLLDLIMPEISGIYVFLSVIQSIIDNRNSRFMLTIIVCIDMQIF